MQLVAGGGSPDVAGLLFFLYLQMTMFDMLLLIVGGLQQCEALGYVVATQRSRQSEERQRYVDND